MAVKRVSVKAVPAQKVQKNHDPSVQIDYKVTLQDGHVATLNRGQLEDLWTVIDDALNP